MRMLGERPVIAVGLNGLANRARTIPHLGYDLHDDHLKLFLDQGECIPHEEYLALKKLGLAWWRSSKCPSGVWTPEREDAILGCVDEIEFFVVDDCGPAYRLERFRGYADTAEARAQAEQQRLGDLLDPIPPG